MTTTDAEAIREAFAKIVVEADRDWNGNVAGYRKYLVDRLTDCGLFVLASRREAQEPVAWRYRWKIDGEWVNWRVSERSQASEHLPSLEEYPLYTAPPSPAPAGEAERLRGLLGALWRWALNNGVDELEWKDVRAALNGGRSDAPNPAGRAALEDEK